jgi:hypothetical protein
MSDANTKTRQGGPSIDYQTYRFGRRQRLYRGPQPDLSKPYFAFLGAERTFGKTVRTPFPDLVGAAMGVPCANLAVEGAGSGFVLDDAVTLEACCGAEVCVVEVMGIWNVSNRFYSVGKRYNRRIRAVSPMLRGLYPKVDFDSFDYVGRMLEALSAADSEKFLMIERECKDAWMVRTRQLLEAIETRTLLFWFSERAPASLTKQDSRRALSIYPEGVEDDMLEQVKPAADAYVECIHPSAAPLGDGPALPSVSAHAAAAEALSRRLVEMTGASNFD